MSQLTVNYIKDCGKCGERSTDYHYCVEQLFDKNYENSENIVYLVFDFPTKSQVSSNFLYQGYTGSTVEQIVKLITHKGFSYIVDYAFPCFNDFGDNKKVSIQEMKEANKSLAKRILQSGTSIIIGFGGKACSTIFGTTVSVKNEIRQRFFDVENHLFRIAGTFTPAQAAMEPKYTEIILKDVDWILDNYNKKQDGKVNYKVIDNDFGFFDSSLIRKFVLDVETMGLSPFIQDKDLLTIAISCKEKQAFGFNYNHSNQTDYVPIEHYDTWGYFKLIELIQNANNTMIGHNIKFDMLWINKKFTTVKCKLYDTLLAFTLLDENAASNSLKSLGALLIPDFPLGYHDDINVKALENEPFEKVIKYNMQDADLTMRLYNYLDDKIKKAGKEKLLEFMNTTLKTVAQIELNGIYCDMEWADKYSKEYKEDVDKLENKLKEDYKMIKKNKIFAPSEVKRLLYDVMNFPVIEVTPTGEPATDDNTLLDLLLMDGITDEQLDFLNTFRAYRKASKIYTTYFEKLNDFVYADGKMHTTYNVGKSSTPLEVKGTVTGRLSSSNPNLTNIPKEDGKIQKVRGMFAAQEGYYLIDADYSQLELRIAAWYAKEYKMYKMFEQGLDIHTAVLADMLKRPYDELMEIKNNKQHKEHFDISKQRVVAKSINFGILYGMGAGLLQDTCRRLKVKYTKEECQEMINQWLKTYSKIAKWIKQIQHQARTTFIVSSPTGRDRHLYGADRQDLIGFGLLRQAVNFPIQTLASEVCLAALNEIQGYIEQSTLNFQIVLTVHDSIIIEVPNEYNKENMKSILNDCMISKVIYYFKKQFGFHLDVPLEVNFNVSKRWDGQEDELK